MGTTVNALGARPTFVAPLADTPQQKAARIADLAGWPCTARDERAIANIVCATYGTALRELIVTLDRKSDPSFEDVVYHAIDDEGVRARILAHLAKHAGSNEVVVVSDYDDTAVPSHDPRFGDTFPGVATLYDEIDRAQAGMSGDLHIVSARPGFVARPTRDRLDARGFPEMSIEASDWGPYIGKILLAVFTFQWGKIGQARRDATIECKLRNIEHQLALHPGQQFVFFGDTVQWDPEVYAEIRRRHPERVKAIVIHEVPGTNVDPARLSGMHVTTTALDSANALHADGVIDAAAVARVAASMEREQEIAAR